MPRRASAAWRTALGLLLVAHAALAWFPFQLEIPGLRRNGARLVGGELRTERVPRAATAAPPSWLRTLDEGDRLVVDVEAAAAPGDQHGPARILAITRDHLRANLVVAQDGNALVVRFRRPGSERDGSPPVVVPGVFATAAWRALRLEADDVALRVVVDGSVASALPVHGWQRVWSASHRLALGNEPAGNRPWHGRIRRAMAGPAAAPVDYLAPGALDVPPRLWFVPSRLTDDPVGLRSLQSRAAPLIAAARLAAFLPLGFAAGRALRRRAALALALAGAGLFLGKTFVAGRHLSVVDVLVAAIGSSAGLAASHLWARRRRVPAGTTPGRRADGVTNSRRAGRRSREGGL